MIVYTQIDLNDFKDAYNSLKFYSISFQMAEFSLHLKIEFLEIVTCKK